MDELRSVSITLIALELCFWVPLRGPPASLPWILRALRMPLALCAVASLEPFFFARSHFLSLDGRAGVRGSAWMCRACPQTSPTPVLLRMALRQGKSRVDPQVDSGKRSTARGFEPLRAEPNGFLVHHLSHSVTLSDGIAGPSDLGRLALSRHEIFCAQALTSPTTHKPET